MLSLACVCSEEVCILGPMSLLGDVCPWCLAPSRGWVCTPPVHHQKVHSMEGILPKGTPVEFMFTPWCWYLVVVTKAEGARPTGMLSLLSVYFTEKHFVWNQFWASPFHLEPPLFFQVDMFGVQATLLAYHLFNASSSASSMTLISCRFEQKVLGEFQNRFKSSQWFCWMRHECWSQSKVTSLLNSPATPRRTFQLRTRRHPTNTTVPSETCQGTRKLSACDKDSSSLTEPSALNSIWKELELKHFGLATEWKVIFCSRFISLQCECRINILYLSSSQRSYSDLSLIKNRDDVAKIILMLDRHYINSSRWRFSHTNIIILVIMINTTHIDKAQTHTVP